MDTTASHRRSTEADFKMPYAYDDSTAKPGGQTNFLPTAEKSPKAKKPKPPAILVDRCRGCEYLAIEPASCRDGRLLQCRKPDCEAGFFPRPNEDDARLKAIVWLISPPQAVDHIDARAFGDRHGLAGKLVGVALATSDNEARRQATFEAVGAYEAGAAEVRIVETTRHYLDNPGALYLEWLNAAVVTGQEVAA